MAQSLASQDKLQALRLTLEKSDEDALMGMTEVKNLRHLSVGHIPWYGAASDWPVLQSIISRSRSTLRTLEITTDERISILPDNPEKLIVDQHTSSEKHDLVALRSLTLSDISFDKTSIQSWLKAIDFMRLNDLTFDNLGKGQTLFFEQLANVASTCYNSATQVSLSTLTMRMSSNHARSYGPVSGTPLEAQSKNRD